MIAKIILYIVLSTPGNAPVPYQKEMESLEACWAAAQEFMKQAVQVEYNAPRFFQAGCVIAFVPREHKA